MIKCPTYVRFPRVVRDIPSSYISAGNHYSNLRQMIDDQLKKENLSSKDIRTREIGRHIEYYKKPAKITVTKFVDDPSFNFAHHLVSLHSDETPRPLGACPFLLFNKKQLSFLYLQNNNKDQNN